MRRQSARKDVKMIHINTTYMSVFPIQCWCAVLGVSSKYKTKNGKFKRCIPSLILALLYMSLYMRQFFTDGETLHSIINYQSYIITVIKESYYVGNAIVMCCVYVLSHLFYSKELKIIYSIDETDQILKRLGLGEELLRKHRFIFKISLALSICVYLVYFLVLELVLHILLFPEIAGLDKVFESVFPTVIITSMKIEVFLCMMVLKGRIEILNEYLASRMEKSVNSSKLGVSYSFGKHVERILKIHKRIVDAARDVNVLFTLQLLLSFGLLFVLFLADGYIVLYYLTVGKSENLGYVLFSCLKPILFHFVELLILLRSCMLLCCKVNHTKDILYKTDINPDNTEARNIIVVSTFQLMHDKLEITACELFDIDYSFLFSMCASMTTYLLILLQFDIEAAKSKMYANSTTYFNETLQMLNSTF